MAITEEARHDMVEALAHSIGRSAAMTLADHLPPGGWGELATKTDLAHLAEITELRFREFDLKFTGKADDLDTKFTGMFNHLDAKFTGMFNHLDTKFTGKFAEVDLRFDLLRAELHTDMANLEVRITDKLTAQTRLLYGSIVTTVAAILATGIIFR